MNPFNTHWEEYHITKFMETRPPQKHKMHTVPSWTYWHADLTQTIFHFLLIFGFARSALQSSWPDALVSHSSHCRTGHQLWSWQLNPLLILQLPFKRGQRCQDLPPGFMLVHVSLRIISSPFQSRISKPRVIRRQVMPSCRAFDLTKRGKIFFFFHLKEQLIKSLLFFVFMRRFLTSNRMCLLPRFDRK